MKIICTHVNASNEINGIKFEDHPKGKISVDEVPDDIAKVLLTIPDFVSADEPKDDDESKAGEPKETKAEIKARLKAEAQAKEQADAEAKEKAEAEAKEKDSKDSTGV